MKLWNGLIILALLLITGGSPRLAGGQFNPPPQLPLAAAAGDAAILLRGLVIQPSQPGAETPAGLPAPLAQSVPGGDGLWLVQFDGPIRPEWLDELNAAGLEVVTYIPQNAYLVWGRRPESAIRGLAARQPAIRWEGAYHPYYRLAPELRDQAADRGGAAGGGGAANGGGANQGDIAGEAGLDVTVQFYNTPLLKSSLAHLLALAEVVYQPPEGLGVFTHTRLRLAANELAAVAAWPDVVNIEPYRPPERSDEIQGIILTGSLLSSAGNWLPTGPGYLEWLNARGFPTNPSAYPLVDVIDDGLDSGSPTNVLHPDFYQLGSPANPDRVVYINNCTLDPTGNAVGGHGNLNAGILAGYNQGSGFPYQDGLGYRYGLGISPYGPIAATKIFKNNGQYDMSRCNGSDQRMVELAYTAGARISSNSWGSEARGSYTVDAQVFDSLTRDATPAAGNQEMLHIFAAGNKGPSTRTVDAPGTAKNVLTVGATENTRDHGLRDGCNEANGASANNMANFSSRGPATDGRIKPDIVAPGTHVSGPASLDPAYTGLTVCGLAKGSPHYPSGQPWYSWSSGTSHSTPAISGAAQLASNHYSRVLAPGQAPSPAMLKALILNAPRYLTGFSTGDTLPSIHQGWGGADLGRMFDDTPRTLIDQSILLTASGQEHNLIGQVQDPTRPLRVTLVWTDAPGSPAAGIALVNDLDLEVTIDGQTYRGNAFSGALSAPSSVSDNRNNVESVFLPAGTQGPFRVRVLARNLAGNGVPGNDTSLDQDFALVIYNSHSAAPYLTIDGLDWQELYGNRNGLIDPGETIALQVRLKNIGSLNASQIVAQMESADPRLALRSATSLYADLLPGSAKTGMLDFLVKVDPDWTCGQGLPLWLSLAYSGLTDRLALPDLPVGKIEYRRYSASGLPARIPDRAGDLIGQVEVPLRVVDSFVIDDLDVMVNITHTWVEDLVILLVDPDGQETVLARQRGGMDDHYQDTVFDDQASQPIQAGMAPFRGRYQPEQPLSPLNGRNAAGDWKLRVQDYGPGDTGWVNAFHLEMRQSTCAVFNNLFEVQVLPQRAWAGGLPGQVVTHTVQIENFSDQPETFDIRHIPGSWPTALVGEVGPLEPGEKRTFTVAVSIPEEASLGESDLAELWISTRSDPQIEVRLVLTTRVVIFYWLPLIHQTL